MIKIKKLSDFNYEILDENKNIFYPDGKGGQIGDRGTIDSAAITEVKEDRIILDKNLSDGEYTFKIDEERRVDIRAQHTAQHIFSALAYNLYNLNTVGFRMAEIYSTVDLDSKDISPEIIEELESKVNEVITNDIVIEEEILTNEEAHKKENLRKQIKDKIKGDVRFIKIGDIDICACAGYHVNKTSEIKLFKLIHYENIKGNYTRFYFLAGDRALKDYSEKHKTIKKLTNIFSCKDNEILEMTEKFLAEKNIILNNLKNISNKYAEILSKNLENSAVNFENIKYIVYNDDENVAQVISKFINLDMYLLLTGFNKNYTLMSNAYDCAKIIKKITSIYQNIKGGGSKNKGNIKLDRNYTENELKEIIEKGIKDE